jgi:ribosome-binding factor A
MDPDFAETYGESQRQPHRRQAQRKTRQLCRQVQQALNLALAAGVPAETGAIFVDAVSPAPDCGHLLVQVVVSDGHSLAEAIAALRRDTARLRAEVAQAITRKRAPELSFIPAVADGGYDD